jgi:hypothetical protein
MPSVRVGDKDRQVQRFPLVKALRAITLLNKIQALVPDGAQQLGEFISEYRKTHVQTMDRVQAKIEYGGEIPIVEDGKPVRNEDGSVLTVRAPIERISDADWEKANNVYRRPEEPPLSAMIAAIFPSVAENAEEPLLRLMAICIIDNDDFIRYVHDDNWREKADEVVRDVLEPAPIEDIIELASVVADVLEGSVLNKMSEVAGKARRLLARLGINLPEKEPETEEATEAIPSSQSADDSNPNGSTSSAHATEDGAPTTSGDSPGISPSDSETAGLSDETPMKPSAPVATS